MAKDNKIQMPSGQGGLTSFSGESTTKFQMSPHWIIIMCAIVVLLIIGLNFLLNGWLGTV
ncbi:hypothetical protein CL619_02690 [archaeon]|nr:hypothetical protein [archaeon]|tara:strand:- start:1261 stop:1440 length:180 start_codon:yes stop_codon:yes gene_type:complete